LLYIDLFLFRSVILVRFCSRFSFFMAAPNERGYAQWRIAGASLSHHDKATAGANPANLISASHWA
jgi:hypothetical protein